MLLTFTLPKFENLIKSGVKKHTIRVDKTNRWEVGRKIEFWKGNPRNVKSNPYQFGTGEVDRILHIEIHPETNQIIIGADCYNNTEVLNKVAVSDGFENWEEMKTFFTEKTIGKLIFWKDFKAAN